MKSNFKKICCFGSGYVGVPTMAVLALYNPLIKFYVYDVNVALIQKWKISTPIFQPGLQQLLLQTRNINLIFTSDVNEALNECDVVYIAVPTPTKKYGIGINRGYDLSCIESVIRSISNYYKYINLEKQIVIIEKSTVPAKTFSLIKQIFKNQIPKSYERFIVVSNPEFLAEGTTIQNLKIPDRVIFGAERTDIVQKLQQLYHFVPSNKIIKTQTITAQLSKLVANCFLAQRISSINSISLICQKIGGDIKQLKKCIGSDSRIGSQFLNASVGFGGSCFKKDVKALVYLAQCEGLVQVAEYWNQVILMNEYRKQKFFYIIYEAMYQNINEKKLSIFGMTFKKNTNDLRQSASIKICQLLLEEGAILNVYDPQGNRQKFVDEMKYEGLWKQIYNEKLRIFNSAQQSVEGTTGIVILTQWQIFSQMDYRKLYEKMDHPSYIFDGRNILDEQKIKNIGYLYYRIGKKVNI